ncbi:Rha family transcriptional regulator [Myroides sp. NP-2]
MSSREIATMTRKRHDHVMRDIRSIEVNLESPNLDSLWKSSVYTI